MQFQKGHLFHIYNQGNNHERIFFNQENHLFFLRKVRTYILPYADIIAWCLMPNHFHFMVYVHGLNVAVSRNNDEPIDRTLNESIGILLRSYTRAINKQETRTGSLFREKTKAECISCQEGITPSFFTTSFGTKINIQPPENQYPQICFNYIHNNPVKARLVNKDIDWDYSSAKDYAGLRSDSLINKERAKEFVSYKVSD